VEGNSHVNAGVEGGFQNVAQKKEKGGKVLDSELHLMILLDKQVRLFKYKWSLLSA
jgi:hypothetical protein